MTDKFRYQTKIYLSLAFFGIIIFFFVFLILIPSFKDIEKNKQDFSFQKERFSLLEYKRLNIDFLRRDYREAEEKMNKIEDLFFSSENPNETLDYIEKESGDCGIGEVSVSEISFFEYEKPWPCFSFQISFSSSFDNFSKFLERIENSPLMLDIQRLTLNNNEDNVDVAIFIKFFTK